MKLYFRKVGNSYIVDSGDDDTDIKQGEKKINKCNADIVRVLKITIMTVVAARDTIGENYAMNLTPGMITIQKAHILTETYYGIRVLDTLFNIKIRNKTNF